MDTTKATIKNLGVNVFGDRTYRVYNPGHHSYLDCGDVVRFGVKWRAWPAVRGEACPEGTITYHRTRREAVEALLSRI